MKLDLMSSLSKKLISSVESLSCLHTIEHFGLGRYGDKIDPKGHLIGFNNLIIMLKKNAILYFSTPIGDQRIEFNAHRIFSVKYLLNLFSKNFSLQEFSYVDDNGNFLKMLK